MGSERRLYPRLDVDLDGHMRLEGSEFPFAVKVSNLSVTGAAVVSDIGLDPGKRVASLEFALPATKEGNLGSNDVTLDLSATVSRRITVAPLVDEEPSYILGLEFQGVRDPVERLIQRFVFQRMMDRRSRSQKDNRQRVERVPYRQPITLSYDWFGDFETQLTENLSVDGMFIRTSKPYPPGTIFDFQLMLRDDFTLVKGRGEVVWIREQEVNPRLPAGMGIRFVHIDDAGRDVIHRVVAHHLEEEAKAGRVVATEHVEPVVDEPAAAPPEETPEPEAPQEPTETETEPTEPYEDGEPPAPTPESDQEASGTVSPETSDPEEPELIEFIEPEDEPAPGAIVEPPSLPVPDLLTESRGDSTLPVAGYASVGRRGRRWLWLLLPLLAIAGLAAWLLL